MPRLLVFVVCALLSAVACKKQDYPTKMCLSEEGTYQDCGIACSVSKSEEACAKWSEQTTKICDERGKQACEELCEADDNAAACEKAKAM